MDEMNFKPNEIYLNSKEVFKKLKKALDSNNVKVTVDDIIKGNRKLKMCSIFTVAEVLDFCGLVEGKIQDLLKKLSSCGFKENSNDKLKDCTIIIDAICKAYSDKLNRKYSLFYRCYIETNKPLNLFDEATQHYFQNLIM